jgi:hypothetical protein
MALCRLWRLRALCRGKTWVGSWYGRFFFSFLARSVSTSCETALLLLSSDFSSLHLIPSISRTDQNIQNILIFNPSLILLHSMHTFSRTYRNQVALEGYASNSNTRYGQV